MALAGVSEMSPGGGAAIAGGSCRLGLWSLLAVLMLVCPAAARAAVPLASDTIHLVGVELLVSLPEDFAEAEALMLPRGMRAFVGTELLRSGADASTDPTFAGHEVRATLVGPDIEEALALTAVPGAAIEIAPRARSGNYTLTDIHLADGQGNRVVYATPSEIPIRVIEQVAVSEVKTRQLSLEEIRERGVIIGEDNFTAYEFTVGIETLSKVVPLTFDIAFPQDREDERGTAFLPLAVPGLDVPSIDVQGIILTAPPMAWDFPVPSIPGAIIIPGNIGFLNDYFEVLLLVSTPTPDDPYLQRIGLDRFGCVDLGVPEGFAVRDVCNAVLPTPTGTPRDPTPGVGITFAIEDRGLRPASIPIATPRCGICYGTVSNGGGRHLPCRSVAQDRAGVCGTKRSGCADERGCDGNPAAVCRRHSHPASHMAIGRVRCADTDTGRVVLLSLPLSAAIGPPDDSVSGRSGRPVPIGQHRPSGHGVFRRWSYCFASS